MVYALLRDALMLLLLGLAGLFTLESILPTFVSLHLNLAYPITLSAILFVILAILGQQNGIRYSSTLRPPTWFVVILLLWLLGVVGNSLLAFHIIPLIVILLLTGISLFFLAKNLTEAAR